MRLLAPPDRRNELRAALKSLCPDGSSEETIKVFVTGCLSSITIVELFNVTSRSIDILFVTARDP